jgi:hypothetical protein
MLKMDAWSRLRLANCGRQRGAGAEWLEDAMFAMEISALTKAWLLTVVVIGVLTAALGIAQIWDT